MITQIDENAALILIDLQKGIAKDTAHPVEQILANAVKLIDAFREKNLPVVLVTVNPNGSKFINCRIEGGRPLAPQGTVPLPDDFADLVPQIKAHERDLLVRKHNWNAFYNTHLHELLQQLGISNIVLGGISTSIGVEGTARAASEFGYNQTFAIDAMSDKVKEAHDCTMNYILPRLGEMGTTDEIITMLNK